MTTPKTAVQGPEVVAGVRRVCAVGRGVTNERHAGRIVGIAAAVWELTPRPAWAASFGFMPAQNERSPAPVRIATRASASASKRSKGRAAHRAPSAEHVARIGPVDRDQRELAVQRVPHVGSLQVVLPANFVPLHGPANGDPWSET